MPSIGGILNTARGAIFAHQAAVQVHSHNIANAGTEGYSRQRPDLVQAWPQQYSYGSIGTGVLVSNISRARDHIADAAVRRETGKMSGFESRRDILGEVESVFGEPSETGLASTLDRFWNAWSDLANQPTSNAARTMVRQRGEQVADAISGASRRLGEVKNDVRSRLSSGLTEVNRISRQIADINVEVVRGEASGKTAGDLRDMRDRLIDQLAALGSTRVVESSNGSVAVSLDGATLVDGATSTELSSRFEGGQVTLMIGASPLVSPREGSRLGQLVHIYNHDIPAVVDKLDNLASGLVTTVNALHRSGETPGGATGVDFFDPAGTSALDMRLSAAVQSDASMVVARAAGRGTTDTSVALGIAGLRDLQGTISTTAGATSFGGYYQEMIAGVAQQVNSAENSYTVHESLTTQAANRRESISGVSIDEELVKLMQSQQAYVAATRLVNTVDEMTQALINMV